MRKLFLFMFLMVSVFVGLSRASFDDLKLLSIGFCSGSSNAMVVSPGEKKDLCMFFTNTSAKSIPVKLGLVAGQLTLDGTKACANDDQPGDKFASLFILDSGANIFTIPAGATVTRRFPLSIPAWVKGQQYGCLVYQSADSLPQGGMFQFIYRNSIDLSLLVVDKEGVFKNNVIPSFSMSISTGGDMLVTAHFANDSDFDEQVIFTGTVSNILGYQKEFESNLVLRVADSRDIVLNLGKVPAYKGLFDLDVDGSYQPYFDGMTLDVIPDTYKKITPFSASSSLFVWSSTILIVLAASLLLLILLFLFLFRKRKIVYVQVASSK